MYCIYFFNKKKYLEVPLCTRHWFRPKGYSVELFMGIIINQIQVEIAEYNEKLRYIGKSFCIF